MAVATLRSKEHVYLMKGLGKIFPATEVWGVPTTSTDAFENVRFQNNSSPALGVAYRILRYVFF